MYELELWELNACIKAFNRKQEGENKSAFVRVWQTANLTGAAFGGKLKNLSHYLPETEVIQGRKLSQEEMNEFDRKLAEKERREEDAGRA